MKTFYIKLNKFIISTKCRKIVNFLITYSILPFIIIYPITLLYLFLTHSPLLFDTFFKPAFLFLAITISRYLINRERPYERYKIRPVKKHKKGKSFPSRHSASALIIALIMLDINATLGHILIICALIVGLSRILGGLHYIIDVAAGFLFSIILYIF